MRLVRLVAVRVRLVRPVDRDVDVVALLLAQHRELGAHGRQVQAGDLLVEVLREQVHLVRLVPASVALLPELELRERLVREGAGHHERRVARGAAQVQQAAGRQHDHAVAIREDEAVHLRLDVVDLDARVSLEAGHVHLVVEWPMLPTIALFFIFSMCFTMMMSLLPVAVLKMSISPTTSSIVVTS